jgi:hypothetical protein
VRSDLPSVAAATFGAARLGLVISDTFVFSRIDEFIDAAFLSPDVVNAALAGLKLGRRSHRENRLLPDSDLIFYVVSKKHPDGFARQIGKEVLELRFRNHRANSRQKAKAVQCLSGGPQTCCATANESTFPKTQLVRLRMGP